MRSNGRAHCGLSTITMFDCHLFARCQNQLFMVGRLDRTAAAHRTSGSAVAASTAAAASPHRLATKNPSYYRKRSRFTL